MTEGPLSGARGAGLVAAAAVAEVATQVATGHIALAVGAFALVLGLGVAPWFKARAAAAASAAEAPPPRDTRLPAPTVQAPFRASLRAAADATPERALADLERAMTQLRQNVARTIDDLGNAAERDGVAIADVAARLAADVREIHEGMSEVVARVDETDARERVQALEIQFAALAKDFGAFIQATAEAAERDEKIVERLDHAARATDRFEIRLDDAREGYARALAALGERLDTALAGVREEAAREARRAEARERDVTDGFERVQATAKRLEREVGDAGQRVEAAVESSARRLESTSRAAADESRRALESTSGRLADDLLAVRATLRGVETRLAEAGPATEARDAASAQRLARLEEATGALGRRLDGLAETFSAEITRAADATAAGLAASDRHAEALEARLRDDVIAARRAVEALEREANETEALLVEKLGDARGEARAAREAASSAATAARESAERLNALESRLAGRFETTLRSIDSAATEARAAATQTLGRIEASDRATSAALANLERALSALALDVTRASDATTERLATAKADLEAHLDSGRAALSSLESRLEEESRRAHAEAERIERDLASGVLATRESLEVALAASRDAARDDRRLVSEALEELARRVSQESERARAAMSEGDGRLGAAVRTSFAEAERATSALAGEVGALARRLDESAARGASRLADVEASIVARLDAAEVRLAEETKTFETRLATRAAEDFARLETTVANRAAGTERAVAELGRGLSEEHARLDAALKTVAEDVGAAVTNMDRASRDDRARLASSIAAVGEDVERGVANVARNLGEQGTRLEAALAEVARGFERSLANLGRDASDERGRLQGALASVTASLEAVRAEVGKLEAGAGAGRLAAADLEHRLLDAIRGLAQALSAREDERASSLSHAFKDFEASQTRLAEDLARIESGASIRANLDTTRHEALAEASKALGRDLEALRAIVTGASRASEERGGRLEAAVAAEARSLHEGLAETLSAVEDAETVLARRLEGLEDAALALQSRLDAVERAVEDEAASLAEALGAATREEGAAVDRAIADARDSLSRETAALKGALGASIEDLARRLDPRAVVDAVEDSRTRLSAAQEAAVGAARADLAGRLAVLGEGLARAEAATARVADALREREGSDSARSRGLALSIEDVSARFAARAEALEAAFSETRGAILAAVTSSTGRSESEATDLAARFGRVESRLDAVVEASRAIETKVAPLLSETAKRVEHGVEAGLARMSEQLQAHAAAEVAREEASQASLASVVASAGERVSSGFDARLGRLEDRLASDLGQVAAAAIESARRLDSIERRLDAAPSAEAFASHLQPLVAAGDLVSKDLAYLAASDDRIAERIESLAKKAGERSDALLTRLGALEERLALSTGVADRLDVLGSETRAMQASISGEMRSMRDDLVRAASAAAEREREALEGLAETATAIEVRFDAFRRDADRRDALVESRLKDATDAARATAERLAASEAVTAARLSDHAAALARTVEAQGAATKGALEAANALALDEMHERLGTLETGVISKLDQAASRMEVEFGTRTGRLAEGLGAIASKVDLAADAARAASERVEGRLGGLEPRFAATEARFEDLARAIQGGFGEAANRTDRLTSGLDAILARVAALDARADREAESERARHERESAERVAESARIVREITALGGRLEDVALDARDAVLERLSDAESADENLALDIRALSGQIESMEAGLARRIDAGDAELAKRLERFEEYARRVESKLSEAEAGLVRRLEDVTRTLDRLTSETTATAETTRSRVVGEVEAINRELRSLEARVADRAIPAARAAADPVESRVADLGARVERALGRLEGLSAQPAAPARGDADAFAARLAALESRRAESPTPPPAPTRARQPAKLAPPTRMPPPRPGLTSPGRPTPRPEASAVQAMGATFASEVAELRRYFQSLDAALSEAAGDVGEEPANGEGARLLAHVNELRADFESLDRRLAAMGDGVAKALGRLDPPGPGKP